MPRYLVGAAKRKCKIPSTSLKTGELEETANSNVSCDSIVEIKQSSNNSRISCSTGSTNSVVNNSQEDMLVGINHNEKHKLEEISELLDDKETKSYKRSKGPSLKVFRCHLCERKFKSWSNLKKHCQEHHSTLPQITCTCGKLLFTRTSVIEHRAKHLGHDFFVCDKCQKSFYRKSLLNQHVASHLPKEQQPFVCCKCARHFHSEPLLKNHERVHLSKEEKLVHPCHLCRKMFSSSSAVSAHLRAVHLGERPFVCDQCGRTFTSKGILQEHLTTHSDFAPWPCSDCSKSFKTKYRLKIHMDIHRGTPYQCPKCPSQLSTRRTLRMHLLVHGDTKPYQCSVCGKAFRRSKDLKNHSTLHSGRKPYTCPFCFRTFANGSNCRSHKRRMHPEELQAYEKGLDVENTSTAHMVDTSTFYERNSVSQEGDENIITNQITKLVQSTSGTFSTTLSQTLNSYYSNDEENNKFVRPLVNPHSVFKDVLYNNQSENSLSTVPAFPGNPYVSEAAYMVHQH